MATMEKTYECCGISYSGSRSIAMQKHFAAVHSKGFKCQVCDRVFSKASRLRSHKLTHLSHSSRKERMRLNKSKKTNKVFECCDTRFFSPLEIRQHTADFHPDGIKCTTCEQVFRIPSLLRRHKLSHHDSKSTAVGESESGDRKENLVTSLHTKNRKIKPTVNSANKIPSSFRLNKQRSHCDSKVQFTRFKKQTRLKKFKKKEINFECCDTRFINRNEIRQHLLVCHPNGIKCSSCKLVFLKPSLYRVHKLRAHSDLSSSAVRESKSCDRKENSATSQKIKRNYDCCDTRFINTNEIRQHLLVCHPNGIKCSSCELVFFKPSLYRLHKLRAHSDSKSTAVRESESSDRKENSATSLSTTNRKRKPTVDSAIENSIKDELIFLQSSVDDRRTTEEVISYSNDSSNKLLPLSDEPIKSIHEETRLMRSQTLLASTVSNLMPLLKRLLTLSSSIMNRIREMEKIDTCSQIIETFELVWNTYKMVIVRWEDLASYGSQDASLILIKNSYGTIPIFINWENSKHLEILENAIALSFNTVHNWQPPATSHSKMEVKVKPIIVGSTKKKHLQPSKPRTKSKETVSKNEEIVGKDISSVTATNVPKSKEISLKREKIKETKIREVIEFCRLSNLAIWENTKERNRSGFKDDNGDYHAMYRYGIEKIINLYCPSGVTHLKCCEKIFNLSRLKTHVAQCHEFGNDGRTEPSISPP